MIGWLKKLHHWSWIWLDGSCWIIIFRRKCSLHICELGLKGECWRVTDWYVKRMQLKHNLSLIVILGSINSVNFNYKMNLSIVRGRIFVTLTHFHVLNMASHDVDRFKGYSSLNSKAQSRPCLWIQGKYELFHKISNGYDINFLLLHLWIHWE